MFRSLSNTIDVTNIFGGFLVINKNRLIPNVKLLQIAVSLTVIYLQWRRVAGLYARLWLFLDDD